MATMVADLMLYNTLSSNKTNDISAAGVVPICKMSFDRPHPYG